MVDRLEQLEALLSPSGLALQARLAEVDPTPEAALRLGAALRREIPADLVAAAFTLRELRHRARAKFTRAAAMYFSRAGYEQASSEIIARWRAARFAGVGRLADLCTGIGGDLIALAGAHPVVAVDRDPLHLRMAVLNAAVYDVAAHVEAVAADVRSLSLTGHAALFIDPARRDEARRLGAARSEPPLDWCLQLAARVAAVGIKTAPGIDHALVPAGWEIEWIAEERELKEAVLWSPALATTPRRATILPAGFTLTEAPGEPVPVAAPGDYLLDPNPAVTRAGLVETLARSLGAWKIDEQIAFLASDRVVRTPFARTLRVVDSLPWHQKEIAARLRALDVGAVDIRRRGLAGDVEAIRRALKLRGSRRATLAMTRVQDRPWCLVCVDLDAAPSEDRRPASAAEAASS